MSRDRTVSSCPSCGQEIKDAFGIVQCPKCKAMLVADFDGNLGISNEGAEEPLAPPEKSVSFRADALEGWGLELPKDDNLPVLPDPPSDLVVPANSESPIDSIDESEPAPATAQLAPEIQEINDFANSERSSAHEGTLFYQIRISGLDTPDVKRDLIAALQDGRLALKEIQNLKGLKDGVLTLEPVNAVKASIIVSRLRELPVDVQWTQGSIFERGAE